MMSLRSLLYRTALSCQQLYPPRFTNTSRSSLTTIMTEIFAFILIYIVIMSKKIFLKIWSDKSYFKIFAYMEKKTSKVIVEVVKAVLYALLGLLGGNAVL